MISIVENFHKDKMVCMCIFAMRKNKSIATLFGFFLAYTLFGQGIVSNTVLCIDSCGHVALEPFHSSSPYFNLTSESDNIHCHSISQKTLKESDCSSCSDMPVSINFSDQNIPTARYESYKIKIQSLSASASVVSLSAQNFYNRFFPKTASPFASILTSLTTTILLI